MMRLATLSASAFLLVACSTQPVSNQNSTRVPAERILEPWLTKPVEGAAKLIVKRDPSFGGVGCVHTVMLDGRPIAELRKGELAEFYVPPRDYVLSVKVNFICGNSVLELGFTAVPTKPFTARISMDGSGHSFLSPTAF